MDHCRDRSRALAPRGDHVEARTVVVHRLCVGLGEPVCREQRVRLDVRIGGVKRPRLVRHVHVTDRAVLGLGVEPIALDEELGEGIDRPVLEQQMSPPHLQRKDHTVSQWRVIKLVWLAGSEQPTVLVDPLAPRFKAIFLKWLKTLNNLIFARRFRF